MRENNWYNPPHYIRGSVDNPVFVGRCLLVYARVVAGADTATLLVYDGL